MAACGTLGWAAALGQAAPPAGTGATWNLLLYGVLFLAVAAVILFGWEPFRAFIARREAMYDRVIRGTLLMDVKPRTVTLMTAAGMLFLGLVAYCVAPHIVLAALGMAAGALVPTLVLRFLTFRRLYKLEDQLVDGIQTLTSGVRAGLNLIQAMAMLAGNGVRPISEEFAHLVREYEHGISLEQAMLNAADRIGSSNYRLLFSALLTHRERGGDLGQTLDRIAESIREIHRLEKRIETLTAPGRTASRWMAGIVVVVALIWYGIDPPGITMLFQEDLGKLILAAIVLLNVVGFLWIRRIVAIDI